MMQRKLRKIGVLAGALAALLLGMGAAPAVFASCSTTGKYAIFPAESLDYTVDAAKLWKEHTQILTGADHQAAMDVFGDPGCAQICSNPYRAIIWEKNKDAGVKYLEWPVASTNDAANMLYSAGQITYVEGADVDGDGMEDVICVKQTPPPPPPIN